VKRFYAEAGLGPAGAGGTPILLDGRPVHTPMRAPLLLPHAALAAAVRDEWQHQGERIDPAGMPLTGLANAAIDQIAPARERFVDQIAAYADSDTLCYRADPGDPLAAHQAEHWDPLLAWAERRYDIALRRIAGILHQPQDPQALAQLRRGVARHDAFMLAGMLSLTGLTGSLVLTLALVEQAFGPDPVWRAAMLEELWQEDRWGADAEATARRAARRREFDAAVNFCKLLQVL